MLISIEDVIPGAVKTLEVLVGEKMMFLALDYLEPA